MSTSQEHDEAASPRRIKRYANRKLYDTRESRYVTLQQIAEFVRAGEDVTIIDNTTKEDLTKVTLAQIIYEEEKRGESSGAVTSVGALRSLIQERGEKLMSSLREGPVGKLIARKDDDAPEEEEVEEPEMEKRTSFFSTSREALEELQRLADDRMRALLGHAITRVHHLQSDVGRLQGRIDELEAKLVALEQARDADAPE